MLAIVSSIHHGIGHPLHHVDGTEVMVAEIPVKIEFSRDNKGPGLCIAGGLGSTPYKGTDEGVFISRVTAGGPADLAGLRINDKVLSVNGISCVNVDHYEAVGILKVGWARCYCTTSRG